MKIFQSAAIAALITGAAGAQAQNSYMFDNPDNHAYFGVRAALDVSSAANGGGFYSNQAGFNIGAIYNIPLYANLYFEPGLSVFYNTFGTAQMRIFETDQPMLGPDGTPVYNPDGTPVYQVRGYQVDGSMRNLGFRIPLLLGYHFDVADDLRVSVFTGPQLNMSLLARYHQNAIHVKGEEENAYSCSLFGTQGFKHFDMQWKFGVGVTYQSYYLDLSGSWGMTRLKDGTELLPRDLRRNLFSITLGYNF